MAAYVGNQVGITKEGFVSMKSPSTGIPNIDKAIQNYYRGGGGGSSSGGGDYAQQYAAEQAKLQQQAQTKALAKEQARQKAQEIKAQQEAQAQAIKETYKKGTTVGQLSNKEEFNFTGKVEQLDKTGKPEETQYFYKGQKVGKVSTTQNSYTPMGSGFQSAVFSFPSGEKVELGKESSIISSMELPSQTQQTISRQVKLGGQVNNNLGFQYNQGTRTDLVPPMGIIPIQPPGTIYTAYEGSAGKDKFGKEIPLLQTYYVKEDYSTRTATKEERNLLGGTQTALTLENTQGGRNKLREIYGEGLGSVKEIYYSPIGNQERGRTKVQNFFAKGGKVGELTGGVILGLIPETKGDVITTAGSFLVGGAVGYGVKGGGFILSKSATASKYVLPVYKFGTQYGGYALGAVYGGGVISKVSSESDYSNKGKIIGENIRLLGAFSKGVKFGSSYGFGEGELTVGKLNDNTLIDSVSLKYEQDGVTYETFAGKGVKENVAITSKQISTKKGGIFDTDIYQPATLRKGFQNIEGAYITKVKGVYGEGIQGKPSINYKSQGFKIKQDLLGGKGGSSDSLAQVRNQMFIGEGGNKLYANFNFPESNLKFNLRKSASIIKEVEDKVGVSNFVAGKRKPVYNLEKGEDYFIYEPSSKVKFNPTVRGKQYDLNKIFESMNNQNDIKVFRNIGGRKTPFENTFGEKVGSKGNTPSVVGKGNQKSIIENVRGSLETPSQTFNKPNLFERVKTKSSGRLNIAEQVRTSSASIQSFKSLQSLGLASLNKTRTGQIQSLFLNQGLGITQKEIQREKLITKQIPITQQVPIVQPIPSFRVPTFKPTKNPIIPGFPLFPGIGGRKGIGSKNKIGKQSTAYQPSFTASVLNLKAKKGFNTKSNLLGGLRLRPIIK